MGLLDEAIRDHLDLRRRHGADPEEIAREELDALAPVEHDRRPHQRSVSDEAPAGDEDGDEARGPADRVQRIAGGDPGGTGEASGSREISFMEETAEIDMRTVLGELEDAMSGEEAGGDAHVRRAIRAGSAAPAGAPGSRSVLDFEADEGSLAWEEPAPRAGRIVRQSGERALGGGRSTRASRP